MPTLRRARIALIAFLPFTLLTARPGGALAQRNQPPADPVPASRFPAPGQPAAYTITDLGAWTPSAINNQRVVVGESGGASSAVLWQDGQLYDLGKFGQAQAGFKDLNDNNQVVGTASNAFDIFLSFRWTDGNENRTVDPGELVWLDDLGGGRTTARAINDAGQVVGTSRNSAAVDQAFLWGPGGMVGLTGANTSAFDINDSGTIVGRACLAPADCDDEEAGEAVMWINAAGPPMPLDAGDNTVRATGINNYGEIIGQYTFFDGFPTRMFLWLPEPAYGQGAGLTVLDFYHRSTDSGGINGQGAVVGDGDTLSPQNSFLWQAGTATDLNTLLPPGSGWVLTHPTGINEFGDIVGVGFLNGIQRAFLLSPPPRWTIFFYFAADNDLDDSYPPIFNHLETMANTPGVNLVVLWDSPAGGDSAYFAVQLDADPNSYAQYTDGENRWPQGELDTGSPLTLSDFVTWGIQNFPAEHYALVLDDHGSGLAGGLCDDSGGQGCASLMNLAEMQLALGTVHSVTGEKMDVLYMAMCLMGMIEDAYQFRDYTDYYVASANLQTTYTDYLTGLDAGFSPAQLADHFAANYAAEMTTRSEDYTISVVAIDRLAPLVAAVDALGQALLAEIDEVGPTLFTLGNLVQRYDNKAPSGPTPADTYADLGHLAELIAQALSGRPQIAAAAQAVLTEMGNAVVFESHRSSAAVDLENSHGLSIFFPTTKSSFYYENNNDFAAGTNWGSLAAEAGSGGGIAWGPMLVSYLALVNPDGEDDPFPPDPIAKRFSYFEIFLPVIVR